MLRSRSELLEAAKSFTKEQLEFVHEAYEAVLSCWNIGMDDVEVAKAFRDEAKCKRDYAAEAAEAGLFESYDDFCEALDIVNDLDSRSMAYC